MNGIEYTILFSVFSIIINFLHFFILIFDNFIKIPIASEHALYVPDIIRKIIDTIRNIFCSSTRPILLLFIIFYIIFYIIYKAIKKLVPDTSIITFFIPIKEILLSIPPLPILERYGIFKLIDCIIKSIGMTSSLEGFIEFNLCFFKFSRDNIRRILKMIFKDIDLSRTILDERFENKGDENIDENTRKIHKNIEEEVNICYKNNRRAYKMGMKEMERLKIEMENNQEYIKCKANSIGKYIRII